MTTWVVTATFYADQCPRYGEEDFFLSACFFFSIHSMCVCVWVPLALQMWWAFFWWLVMESCFIVKPLGVTRLLVLNTSSFIIVYHFPSFPSHVHCHSVTLNDHTDWSTRATYLSSSRKTNILLEDRNHFHSGCLRQHCAPPLTAPLNSLSLSHTHFFFLSRHSSSSLSFSSLPSCLPFPRVQCLLHQ